MKLRYFYIICFIISIDWSFCYECINNEKALRPHGPIKRHAKSKHGGQKNQHRRARRHQEYEEEKDPVANIDIASFIQQPDPDYEAVEDPRKYKNRRRASRYYDDYESLNDMETALENSANENLRNDLEDSNILFGEKLSDLDKVAKNGFSAALLRQKLSANKDDRAKISKRRQAIPFFSRNKKEKKHKKRKLFNFGSKSTSRTTLLPKTNDPKADLKNQFKKIDKRSNFDRFCPLCKRKIERKSKNEKQNAPRKIHNSRQYFQNLGEIGKKAQKKSILNNEFRSNKLGDREKRDYDEGSDKYINREIKERQLKQLEDIQKKVDSIDISFPHEYPSQKIEKS